MIENRLGRMAVLSRSGTHFRDCLIYSPADLIIDLERASGFGKFRCFFGSRSHFGARCLNSSGIEITKVSHKVVYREILKRQRYLPRKLKLP